MQMNYDEYLSVKCIKGLKNISNRNVCCGGVEQEYNIFVSQRRLRRRNRRPCDPGTTESVIMEFLTYSSLFCRLSFVNMA